MLAVSPITEVTREEDLNVEATTISTQRVTINETHLPVLTYRDQHVVTFAMIDEVHGRKPGTARNRFGKNRHRFTEGKHFYHLSYQEVVQMGAFYPFENEPSPRGLTLVTEAGYLLMVKSFNDDVAWEVQDILVDSYFRLRKIEAPTQSQLHVATNLSHQAAAYIEAECKLDALFEIPKHITLSECVKSIRVQTGLDLSQKLLTSGAMDNIAADDMFLEVADLCKRYNLPLKSLNPLLVKHGWQTKLSTGQWEASERAQQMGLCKRHQWSAEKKSGYNWKWRVSFIETLLK